MQFFVSPEFTKEFKRLSKKYKNIHEDIKTLKSELTKKPESGTPLGSNVYKIRIKNSDIDKGKSAGYRVVYYLQNEQGEIYLLTIYSKSDQDSISDERIDALVKPYLEKQK